MTRRGAAAACGRRRSRPPSRGRRRAAAAWRGCGRSSSCRRRWARAGPRTVPSSTSRSRPSRARTSFLRDAVDLDQAFRGDGGHAAASRATWSAVGSAEYTERASCAAHRAPAPATGALRWARPPGAPDAAHRLPGPIPRRPAGLPPRLRPWLERWGGVAAPARRRVRRVARVRRRCCPSCRSTSPSRASISRPSALVIAAWPAARLVERAGLRLARRPDGARPADGHRARRARRLRRAAAASSPGHCAFLAAARRRRPRRRDLRPGRPRLPDRRDADRAPRRGVRAVRRGPDGRPAARPGDRRPSGPRTSAASASCSSSARSPRSWRRSRSRCASARRRCRPGARDPRPITTEFPPDAPYLERRRAAEREAPTADARPRAGAPTALAQPRPDRGDRHQRRGYFAGGTYEVIWSLFLQRLGRTSRSSG